ATGPFGVWVFDTNGTVLDTIMIPGQTANCTWGNADGRTLYVTSEDAVYRVSNIYHK
ncbi:MAG: SMP-30/gluconolactonase/LRE family protein, partial [Candidatus Marinimicrobia bacterium]|nr:SMP-30/gluconolactonase/LRE family protein [Candidatus Neomarinimicrobiota bacterium]